MGTVAVANKAVGSPVGKHRVVEADVTFSSSYATGGDTLTAKSLGLRQVHQVLIPSHHVLTGKVVADASARAGKTVQLAGTAIAPLLKVYDTANTEVAAATNLSTVVIRCRFLGI